MIFNNKFDKRYIFNNKSYKFKNTSDYSVEIIVENWSVKTKMFYPER